MLLKLGEMKASRGYSQDEKKQKIHGNVGNAAYENHMKVKFMFERYSNYVTLKETLDRRALGKLRVRMYGHF